MLRCALYLFMMVGKRNAPPLPLLPPITQHYQKNMGKPLKANTEYEKREFMTNLCMSEEKSYKNQAYSNS